MGSVVSSVVDVVEDVAESVGDAVQDVAKAVETTAKAVVENPEILVIAVAAPYALPYVGITGVAIAPVTAGLITASQGGDIEDIGKSALTAYIAPQIGQAAGQAAASAGLQNTLANAVGGAAGSATAAAIQGGDIGKSALLGGVSSGVSAGVKDYGVEMGLTPETAASIGRVVGGAAGGAVTGDVRAGTTSALLNELNRELRKLQQEEIDIGFGPGRYQPEYTEQDIVGMSKEQFDRMMSAIEQDLSEQERAELDMFGEPDYSLAAGMTREQAEGMGGGQGLRARLRDLRDAGEEDIDYEDLFESEGGEGLRPPTTRNRDDMGGGTGITAPKEGDEEAILRQIQEELYPSPDFEGEDVDVEPTDLSSIRITTAGQTPQGMMREAAAGMMREAAAGAPSISSRVTGEAGAGILGDKEPLFGGDEDEQRAVWNRRSLRLRRALGL